MNGISCYAQHYILKMRTENYYYRKSEVRPAWGRCSVESVEPLREASTAKWSISNWA